MGNGHKVDANAAVQIKTKDIDIAVQGKLNAEIDLQGRLRSLNSTRLAIELKTQNPDPRKGAARLTLLDLQFEEDRLGSAFGLRGSFDGTVDDLLAPVNATGTLSGSIALNGDILSVSVKPKGQLSIDRIELPNKFEIKGPLTAKLTAPSYAQIDIAKGLPSLTYEAKFVVAENRMNAKAGDNWIEASLSEIPITVAGNGDAHHIDMNVASIEFPKHKMRAPGIDVDLALSKNLAASLNIKEIKHQGVPSYFVPLRLTATAHGNRDRLAFDGRLFDPPERISVNLSGHLEPGHDRGELTVDSRKLVFLPTVLQPAQLFPILGRTLREVDGEIDALAKISWQGESVDSSLDFLVNASLIKADEFTFENVASVVRFDSLFPLSTHAKQEVNIGLLDVGLPMLNGRLEFKLERDGSIRAALRELDFFGGRIETQEFTIPKTFDGFTVPLQVNGVALENFLALAQSGDLTATGTLHGSIPVAIENGKVAVRNGILESSPGGGSIRYRPTAVGPSLADANEGMKLFLQIVEDFQYDKVMVTLDEDELGEVAFGFKIQGRNQAVYKGFPVELNVSMDGPLRKILSQGLKTYKHPERILSEMRRFEDAP